MKKTQPPLSAPAHVQEDTVMIVVRLIKFVVIAIFAVALFVLALPVLIYPIGSIGHLTGWFRIEDHMCTLPEGCEEYIAERARQREQEAAKSHR